MCELHVARWIVKTKKQLLADNDEAAVDSIIAKASIGKGVPLPRVRLLKHTSHCTARHLQDPSFPPIWEIGVSGTPRKRHKYRHNPYL